MSFDRLTSVIGPAPSEMPFEQFTTKLRLQRERISTGLVALRVPRSKTRSASAAAKAAPKTLKALAKQADITITDLQMLIQKELKGK